MKILASRKWSEPKLKLPKFCNNKNKVGTIQFRKQGRSCRGRSCPVWKFDNCVYVHHRDWNSAFVGFGEAKRMGIIDKFNRKFVYNDNFGGVILAGSALIEFSPDDFAAIPRKHFGETSQSIVYSLCERIGDSTYSHLWVDFFEQLLVILGIPIWGVGHENQGLKWSYTNQPA